MIHFQSKLVDMHSKCIRFPTSLFSLFTKILKKTIMKSALFYLAGQMLCEYILPCLFDISLTLSLV